MGSVLSVPNSNDWLMRLPFWRGGMSGRRRSSGEARRNPCPYRSRTRGRRSASSDDSIPSAMVRSPRVEPSCASAATIALPLACASVVCGRDTSRSSGRSLKKSIGRRWRVRQRCVAGAEVVHPDVHTEVPHGPRARPWPNDRRAAAPSRSARARVSRVRAGTRRGSRSPPTRGRARESWRAERFDRDPTRPIELVGPGPRLFRRRAENPRADLHDEAGLFPRGE